MITYPEIRAVKQQGCRISYYGLLLLGVIACFLFFIRTLELYGLVYTVVRGSVSRVLFFCLQRILRVRVFELRATHRRIAHMCSFLFCSPSAIICCCANKSSINISAWGRRTTSSLLELSALTGSPSRGLRLPQIIYIGCVFIGSSESEPTSVTQLRGDYTPHAISSIIGFNRILLPSYQHDSFLRFTLSMFTQ